MKPAKLVVEFEGKITEATIKNRITKMFPKKIEWDKPISTYISGNPAAVKAYYAVINAFDGFEKDGLRMQPSDLQAVATLRGMSNAIIVRYLRQGWHVSA